MNNDTATIADMRVPDWDVWFMAMTFLYAMRSPDRQTKQGCLIVDWPSKIPIGFGYNGHPRKAVGLPVDRPEKYPFIVHADANAVANCMSRSDHAVVYLPMPPCEVCLGLLVNMPFTAVRRILYFEHRDFPNTKRMLAALQDGGHPLHMAQMNADRREAVLQLLDQTKTYVSIRDRSGATLTQGATAVYRSS